MYEKCIKYEFEVLSASEALISEKFKMKNNRENNAKFVITKRIAKHGNQAVIVIPKILEQHLKPGTIVQLGIDVLDRSNLLGGKE